MLLTFKPCGEVLQCRIESPCAGCFALPDRRDTPAHLFQFPLGDLIPQDILSEFLCPELDAGLRRVRPLASIMSVPKATMYKDHLLQLGENNIWLPRQVLDMKSESKSETMQSGPDFDFRPSVP